jgi:integrase
MSLIGQKTTTTFLPWETYLSLVAKLERDKNYKFCLLLAIGVNTGLRIGDLLKLTVSDVMNGDTFKIQEGKTGKERNIKINKDLRELLNRVIPKYIRVDKNQLLFLNKYGTKAIDKSYVNVKFKEICKHYKIKVDGNISSHTFRKTLGRRVAEVHNYSDQSFLMLSKLFNHSNTTVTRTYLGITEEEIHELYDSICI